MRFYLCLFLFLPSLNNLFSQDKFTISGYVTDLDNGEEMIGATVRVKNTTEGAVTNIYGFYSLTLAKGEYDIVYSFIGYSDIEKRVVLDQNQQISVEISNSSQTLQEVEITAERGNTNVESVSMSSVEMNIETIKKIPALMGEVDVIRAIQLLPGVQSSGEGSTGFFVRGGGADQNLVLLDEATVFNSSHLLGFFSVFNQDAIKDAKLYKGGIPAKYGGRLSSVLDVRMKEGNSKRFSVSGGIGLISSRLTIEAPIVKDKSSFIISGRRTYADLFLNLSKNEDLKNSALYFYDLNGKFNYKLSDKDRLFVSGYFGRDILNIADAFKLGWGNTTITTRWNHLFSEKLFSNVSLIYSNYNYELGIPDGIQAFAWNSDIINYSIKNDYTLYANTSNTIRFGFQSTFLDFNPATFEPLDGNENFNSLQLPKKFALESGIYLSNEQKIGSRFTIDYGMRLSIFQNIGIDTVYQYDENYDLREDEPFKTYGKGEFYNTYMGLEPRLGMKYTLDEFSSVKMSYNRMFQYLHLANNSTGGTPLDVWFPSSSNIKPRIADQVALGYFRNFNSNTLETSAEVYYKEVTNAIDFKDNAQLIFNSKLEGEVRIGSARAYGLELFARKQQGKFTGWISYTLSRTLRTIDEINDGKEYVANFDRPHNLSIVLAYDINPQWSLGFTWVYNTGLPLTAPTGKFTYQGQVVPVYSERNGARIPDYHRSDFSVTLDPKKNEGRRFKSSWNLSVYNMYARKNPFSITFEEDDDNPGQTQAIRTYLFSIIPTVTYNFKF